MSILRSMYDIQLDFKLNGPKGERLSTGPKTLSQRGYGQTFKV